jgi:hypothetical protein
MPKFICNDGNGAVVVETETTLEAAQEFVDSGSWGEIEKTCYVTVNVTEKISERTIRKFVGDVREINMVWNGKILVYASSDSGDDLPFSEKEKEEIKEEFPKCEFDEQGDLIIPFLDATHTIAIDPNEPECEENCSHDWKSPYSVLGGLKENPGVWGNGGGVIIKEVCCYCGKYKITNTWAQNPENGEQGLTSIEYDLPDDGTMEYVDEMK